MGNRTELRHASTRGARDNHRLMVWASDMLDEVELLCLAAYTALEAGQPDNAGLVMRQVLERLGNPPQNPERRAGACATIGTVEDAV